MISKSIDLDWVLRLADTNPGEAVKCLVYYLKLKENLSSVPTKIGEDDD